VNERARRTLLLLAVAELLGMSLWFTASAVSPELARRWSLGDASTGWLTAIVQLGFVAGTATAAILNLADIWPARRFFAASALVAALANALLLVAPSYAVALGLRFATGAALAGVYPPAMKMIATWYQERRGMAIGVIVGALTLGKATPYLVHALAGSNITPVILAASLGACVAATMVALGYHDGPYAFERRPFAWSLVRTVVAQREWRLATCGYLGHMWELYSFWTWISAFLFASAAVASRDHAPSSLGTGLLAYGAIAVGAIGCIWGGLVADRIGHAKLVVRALAASGLCALLAALAFGTSLWLIVPLVWAWGFFVIADSAQFSTLVTRAVPPHAVGTALTLQTSLGFLLTMASIQLVPVIVRAAGWRWAFAMLAVGPAVGIMAIRRLAPAASRRLRRGATGG
jgi:MFS family permease